MSIARQIVQQKRLDELFAIAATIPWDYHYMPALFVRHDILLANQGTALGELLDLKGVSYEDGEYSFARPHSFEPLRTPLWNLLYPAAETRFNELSSRIKAMPWQYEDFIEDYIDSWGNRRSQTRFFIRIDRSKMHEAGLTPAQVRELEALVRNKDIQVTYGPKEVIYFMNEKSRVRYGTPRLWYVVEKGLKELISGHGRTIGILPWESINGGFALDAAIFEKMNAAPRLTEVGANVSSSGVEIQNVAPILLDNSLPGIFARWKIKLTADGKYYILLKPQEDIRRITTYNPTRPTIMQTADRGGFLVVIPGLNDNLSRLAAPLGNELSVKSGVLSEHAKAEDEHSYQERDWANYWLFIEVSEAISARNMKVIESNRFAFDPKTGFHVNHDSAAVAESINSSTALIEHHDQHYIIADITATGEQWQDGEILRQELEKTIPEDFDIGDLGNLMWQYDIDGREMTIDINAFCLSVFAQAAQITQSSTHLTVNFADGRTSLNLPIDAEKQKLYETAAKHKWKIVEDGEGFMMDNGHGLFRQHTHPNQLTIDKDDFSQFPYYVAISRAIRKRNAEFVSQNLDAILALPWWFTLNKKIDFARPRIDFDPKWDRGKLKSEPEVRKLVEQLLSLNLLSCSFGSSQLRDHWGYHYNTYGDDRRLNPLFDLLVSKFEQWKASMIEGISSLPWRYDGHALILETSNLTQSQQDFIAQAFNNNWSVLKDPDHPDLCRIHSRWWANREDDAVNDLRAAIAKNVNKTRPKQELAEDILLLPWHFAGQEGDWDIVIEMDKPTDAQREVLDSNADIYISLVDDGKCGPAKDVYQTRDWCFGGKNSYLERYKYRIYGPTSDNVADTEFQSHLYSQLLPIAQRNFARLINEVAAYPWQANAEGKYEVQNANLTDEQQKKMRSIPGGLLDLESMMDDYTKYNGGYAKLGRIEAFVVDSNADNILVAAIRTKQSKPLPQLH